MPRRWLPFLAFAVWATGTGAYADSPVDPRQTWQLLDYIAVDYRGAVRDGEIVSAPEYSEMQEFAATAREQIAALPEQPGRERLYSAAAELAAAIDARKPSADVARLARKLAESLLVAYPVPLAPKESPDLGRGRELYAAQCSACHGLHGAGDGPAARTLDPPPIAFTDHERAQERTPFGYYQIITQGVAGTSMTAFAGLPDADRWALAFYAGTLVYSPAQRQSGETLWRSRADLRAAIPSLETVAATSERTLAAAVGADQAGPLLAFVRGAPEVLGRDSVQGVALARARLAESVRAYMAGRTTEAQRLALSAYLDGIEPLEPLLAATNAALLSRIEAAMGHYRASLTRNLSPPEIAGEVRALEGLLDLTEQALTAHPSSRGAAFVGSFTILLREGLEALLVVVAILAFLRKAQRPELLPYVHAGWISALMAGAVTWAAATYAISISGAHREVTEGASSLFAALVLLSVGLWMHGKSLAGRWQQYLTERLSHALSRRSVWFLAALAFISVYREVFETILFYAALWTQGQHGALVGGFAAATFALAIIAYVMLRVTGRLPIGQFFAASAVLVGALAVVLAGKGIAALQEAGLVQLHPVSAPRVDVLGVYPTLETLATQAAVLLAVVAGFAFNHLRAPRLRSGATPR